MRCRGNTHCGRRSRGERDRQRSAGEGAAERTRRRSCPVAPSARYPPDMVSDVGGTPLIGDLRRRAIPDQAEFDRARIELEGEWCRRCGANRPGRATRRRAGPTAIRAVDAPTVSVTPPTGRARSGRRDRDRAGSDPPVSAGRAAGGRRQVVGGSVVGAGVSATVVGGAMVARERRGATVTATGATAATTVVAGTVVAGVVVATPTVVLRARWGRGAEVAGTTADATGTAAGARRQAADACGLGVAAGGRDDRSAQRFAHDERRLGFGPPVAGRWAVREPRRTPRRRRDADGRLREERHRAGRGRRHRVGGVDRGRSVVASRPALSTLCAVDAAAVGSAAGRRWRRGPAGGT